MRTGLDLQRVHHGIKKLLSLGIRQESVCVVGSSVLQLHGLREAGDIDFALTNDAYDVLRASGMVQCLPSGTINVTDEIQVGLDRYAIIGISDEELFTNDEYVHFVEGIRVARPELEFGKKLFRDRPKDRVDTALLLQYALKQSDWRWDWVPVSPIRDGRRRGAKRDLLTRLMSGARIGIKAFRHPKLSLRKVTHLARKRAGVDMRRPLAPTGLSVQQLDTGTLLQLQFHEGLFPRYDTLLRADTMDSYLALQRGATERSLSLLRPDHETFSNYNRMQDLRVSRESAIRFQELVASIERKGFHTDRYPVTLDGDGRLKDGSHRLSAALHYGIETMPVRFVPGKTGPVNYGREWFENHGFEEDYLKRLDKRLRDCLINTGAAFQLIVWPPAMPFENEIYETIAARYSLIAEIRNINLQNFPEFVEAAYVSDDIEQWKIQKKIYHMRQYKPAISVFSFFIDEPRYRVKTRTQSYLSDTVAKLKAEIRNRYKDQIEGYVHDIVTHIGDNPAMNRDMVKTLRAHGAEFMLLPSNESKD